MAIKNQQLGPWPLGQDRYHSESPTHSVYQGSRDNPARLLRAVNVDIDDSGWPKLRSGVDKRTTLTSGKTVFSGSEILLVQDGTSILEVDLEYATNSNIVTGLSDSSRVEFVEHAGQIFWTNGTDRGRIYNSTAYNWGATLCPVPSLQSSAGGLAAGRYLVAGEFLDSSGILHPSDGAAVISLSADSQITVSFSSYDSNAEYIRLYVAGPNDDVLYLLDDIAIAAFPYTITSLPTEDTVCWTIGLSPPPNHDFGFSYQDRLMLVSGQWIYPSMGAAVHLYDIGKTTIGRPETILAGKGLPSGFWTVSSRGAYWTTGQQPEQWVTWDTKIKTGFCKGSALINSSAIPGLGLNSNTPIALFWSKWGLAIGMDRGEMIFPLKDRYFIDNLDNIYATFGFKEERSGLRRLVVSLGVE